MKSLIFFKWSVALLLFGHFIEAVFSFSAIGDKEPLTTILAGLYVLTVCAGVALAAAGFISKQD